jgi:hypothetical protein
MRIESKIPLLKEVVAGSGVHDGEEIGAGN